MLKKIEAHLRLKEVLPFQRSDAIDQIGFVFDDDGIELGRLYGLLLANPNVEATKIPTLEQILNWFSLTRKGLQYARDIYGQESVPAGFKVYTGTWSTPVGKVMSRFIGYAPDEDEFVVSLEHIAEHAHVYGNQRARFTDYHLPVGTTVSPEDHTILQGIEEAYHRYQKYALGIDMVDTSNVRTHPIEIEITSVFDRAISDLGIDVKHHLEELSNLHPYA